MKLTEEVDAPEKAYEQLLLQLNLLNRDLSRTLLSKAK